MRRAVPDRLAGSVAALRPPGVRRSSASRSSPRAARRKRRARAASGRRRRGACGRRQRRAVVAARPDRRRAIRRRCRFASAARSSSGACASAIPSRPDRSSRCSTRPMLQKNAASARAQLDAAEHRLVYAKQQLDRDRGAGAGKPDRTRAARADHRTPTRPRSRSAIRRAAGGARRRSVALRDAHRRSRRRHHRRSRPTPARTFGQARPSITSTGAAISTWSATCPEARSARSRSGSKAHVTLAALPGKTFEARVRELSPAADPQSRTWRAKLTLDSAEPGRAPRHDGQRRVRTAPRQATRQAARPSRCP